jgi:hypothetical protein
VTNHGEFISATLSSFFRWFQRALFCSGGGMDAGGIKTASLAELKEKI